MRYFLYFCISTLSCFGFQSAHPGQSPASQSVYTTAIVLDSNIINHINSELPVNITIDNSNESLTPAELVRYLIDILCGILATIILAWLHKKFPNIFPKKKPGKYIDRNS